MKIIEKKTRDLNIIYTEIEEIRGKLNNIVIDMECPREEVLKVSQKLDILINEYIGNNKVF